MKLRNISILDKRSKNGTILRYEINTTTANIVQNCLDDIKKNKLYKIFISKIDNELVDLYLSLYNLDRL